MEMPGSNFANRGYSSRAKGPILIPTAGRVRPAGDVHTAVITQPELLHALIEPFLKEETPKGMFD